MTTPPLPLSIPSPSPTTMSTPSHPRLEIAAFTLPSAITAASAGADRIELCTNPSVGGTTPPLSTFQELQSHLLTNPPTPVPKINIMIRPHRPGGPQRSATTPSFTYTPAELATMKEDIIRFKDAGADGFVFGILQPLAQEVRLDQELQQGYTLDVPLNTALISLAAPLPCTLHRAFDLLCPDQATMTREVEAAISCGFSTILTSAGEVNALAGAEKIGKLVELARGRVEIMPGGGVRSQGLGGLRRGMEGVVGKGEGGIKWVHSSAIVDGDGQGGGEASAEEVRALKAELESWSS